MEEKFRLGESLEKQLLKSLILDRTFLLTVCDLIKPEYFERKPHAIVFKVIRDHFNKYKDTPTYDVIANSLKDYIHFSDNLEQYCEFVKELQTAQVTTSTVQYLKDEVVNFCKRQAYKIVFLKSMESYIDKNEFDKIDEMCKKASLIGLDTSPAYDYFVDPLARLVEEKKYREHITTGLPKLDEVLDGGWEAQEHPLCLVMAPSNVGKSIALVHFGAMAVMSRKKVIHYTFEMSENMVAKRYDAALTRVRMNNRLDNTMLLAEKIKMIGQTVGNNLRIKYFPTGGCTVNMLRANLQKLVDDGFVPDIIIVDYLDIMKDGAGATQQHVQQKNIAEGLRALALEVNAPVVSAVQTNRGGKSASKNNEILEDDLIADSYDKIKVADFVMSINQTPNEFQIRKARLYINKNRDGSKGNIIPIELCYMQMRIRQWEHAEAEAEENVKRNQIHGQLLDDEDGIEMLTELDFE